VATSTKASLGVGCPSRSEVCFLMFSNSSFSIKPAWAQAASNKDLNKTLKKRYKRKTYIKSARRDLSTKSNDHLSNSSGFLGRNACPLRGKTKQTWFLLLKNRWSGGYKGYFNGWWQKVKKITLNWLLQSFQSSGFAKYWPYPSSRRFASVGRGSPLRIEKKVLGLGEIFLDKYKKPMTLNIYIGKTWKAFFHVKIWWFSNF